MLINNAGILPKDVPLEELSPESMREGFEVNCLAPLFLTRALLPLLQTAAEIYAGGKSGRSIGKAAVVQVTIKALKFKANFGRQKFINIGNKCKQSIAAKRKCQNLISSNEILKLIINIL